MNLKTIIILLLAIFILYFAGHYVIYGQASLFKNSIYTEKVLPVPEALVKGEVVVAKDAYLAIGRDKEHAKLESFGRIERQIVSPQTKDYFTKFGLTIEPLKKRTSFKVASIIEITKHGIATIDSGPGPNYYLILKDNDGVLYQIAIVFLGTNSPNIDNNEVFLSFTNPSEQEDSSLVKFLGSSSFDSIMNEKPFGYNGELVVLSEDNLEKRQSQSEELLSRLESGEKFLITVKLEAINERLEPITLSDNFDERFVQVSEIQDRFLSKIPSNIDLINLKKDKGWPNVSMEANTELLNYLIKEKQTLHIETISELTILPYAK